MGCSSSPSPIYSDGENFRPEASQFVEGDRSDLARPIPFVKYFCFSEFFTCRLTQITPISPAIPPHRGALRNVTDAERDAVDADAPMDDRRGGGRQNRVVLTSRRWRQVGG